MFPCLHLKNSLEDQMGHYDGGCNTVLELNMLKGL